MKQLDRRRLLTGAMGLPVLTKLGNAGSNTLPVATERSPRQTVRDHLWIFTTVAGGDNKNLAEGGVKLGSRMTPAEGAFYLGIPNLIMVRWRGLPPFEQCEQYAQTFRPLQRVVWSIVGSGGRMDGDELPYVLDLVRKHPNITGIFLDDFFVRDKQGGKYHTGSLSPQGLEDLRGCLNRSVTPLEMWVTFYSRVFDPSHPGHFEIDLPLRAYLDNFDVITLWTRGGNRLENLEEYLERLEEASPGPHKAIGCDFWDFRNRAPVPIRLMEHQCNLGLKWLREGRIREMIFLANTVMDVGLEVVEWTRRWIQDVGDQPLTRAG